jgi:hypothetical protein
VRIEFGASQVWPGSDHTILAGRAHEAGILLGDEFTALVWTPWLPEPVGGSRVGEPTVRHAVALRVETIEAYGRSLDFLSSGMTGALRLSGAGQELLRAVDPSRRDGAWLLVGERGEQDTAADRAGKTAFLGTRPPTGPAAERGGRRLENVPVEHSSFLVAVRESWSR